MIYNWYLAKHIKYNTNAIDTHKAVNDNHEPFVYEFPITIEFLFDPENWTIELHNTEGQGDLVIDSDGIVP